MVDKSGAQNTLTDDQIRVSENVQSVTDILRSSKPYLDAALKAMDDPSNTKPIEVAPYILRDLVAVLTAELKMSQVFSGSKKKDKGDGDLNPFNGIDFEFD
jgi:hypothetical protein